MAFTDRLHNRGSISTGYDIDNSVKLEADNTEYFSRTPSSNSNRQNFTFSTWVKRTELGQNARLIDAYQDGQNFFTLGFDTSDRLVLYNIDSGVDYGGHYSQRFRDTSAWYHIVFRSETTSSTATTRWKLYVNGVEITSKDTDYGTPPRWYESNLNSTISHKVGYNTDGSNGSSQYMAETHLVDGTALAPTAFGEFDEDSGIWKPIEVDVTYGTNGFYLDYADASDLGDDESGNGNDFTENNITSADQSTDTPTNNFVTWLSDGTLFNIGSDNMLFVEGGTRMLRPAGTGWTTHYANMAASSGKWYFEHESAGANNTMMGAIPVSGTTDNTSGRNNHYLGNVAGHGIGYQFVDRYVYQNGSYALNGGNNANSGNIVQVALDLDNGKIYFGLDNTWITAGTGANPSTGSNGNSLSGWSSEQLWMFAGSTYNPNVQQSTNFGGYTEMSISSAASDANGYGTFEYAPPTGFYALCTKNLAEYG